MIKKPNNMKRMMIAAAAALLFPCFSAHAGGIITDSMKSGILGSEVKYNVYLPDGYEKSGKQYPVIYLLHGLTDDYRAWDIKGGLRTVADELIRTGESSEVVIIMPNAGGEDFHNVWNGYFNMPGWNYEDFFFNEFLPTVEEKYRIVGDKGHRAVMGLSMGGGGSTVYCQRHPDMFSSCYAMSAWLDQRLGNRNRDKKDKDCFDYVCDAVEDHSALKFIDNADEATLEALRTVKWFFDCGDDDGLLPLSTELHFKMNKAKIDNELRVRNGGHGWEYWHLALRLALPFASRNFDK